MKKNVALFLSLILISICILNGCGSSDSNNNSNEAGQNGQVKIYNFGEYIDEDVVSMFEKETGIEVVYDMFETNEDMYPIIEAGAVSYDAVCTSDYMIAKMIENNLLSEIDTSSIENMQYVDPVILEKSKDFDPENKYSVPYTFGTLGIMYNTSMVTDTVDSWNILWNEKYSNEILMYNSVRDLFAAPLKSLGFSLNTVNESELQQAKELLIQQKPIVQSYIMDQIKDTMISGSAALTMAYSGEFLTIQEENPDIQYVVPKEGSNFFIDSWVIPANSQNKENAQAWINFLNRPDIALKNFEYTTYSTPNTGAQDLISEDIRSNKAVFPDKETINNCEVFHTLGEEGDSLYNNLWIEVKGA